MPDRARTFQRVPENQPGYREANTAFLRAEIRETRDRMSDTLDELGNRLNPHRLKAQVKENIREATVGRVETMARNAADRVNETRHGMIDRIRENPIPAALIGIGLGWMLFGGRRRDERTLWDRSYVTDGNWDGTAYVGDISATTPRLAQDDAAGGIGESVSREPGVVDRVKERVTGIGETVRDTTSDVAYSARERVSDVAERVSDVRHNVSDSARYRMHSATERFDQTLNENPVAIGVVAMAVGMAAGLAIPESRREREMMGPYRDQLVDRVRERVDDTRERVQHVAERVVEETKEVAKDAAREEGLVS
jgi:ElaB/YqjD/DUF883 family membrane-anchored ribosome-binding protein